MQTSSPSLPHGERFAAIDAIRFVCALWVLFSHAGFLPLTPGSDKHTFSGLAVSALANNLFWGGTAVIVFFVISGFCIHYPYRERAETSWPAYFVRRYLRIGIPMLAAYVLAFATGAGESEEGVMWTLRCEIGYYTLYPLLLKLRDRFGWNPVIAASAALWLIALAVEKRIPEDVFRFAAGLPCWLLGAKLADTFQQFPVLRQARLWAWRAGMWVLSSTLAFLHFHSPLHTNVSHTLFGFAAFFWLGREIQHFRHGGVPSPLLAAAGLWSYSVYIVHVPAMHFMQWWNPDSLGLNLDWARLIGFTLLASYVFYRLVENPGHLLARALSRRLRNRSAAQVLVVR